GDDHSGDAAGLRPPPRGPWPAPLPVPAAPVAGEALRHCSRPRPTLKPSPQPPQPAPPRDSRHVVSGGTLRWSREVRPTLYLCGPRHGCLVSGPVTTGTESERERDKRHYQRALFNGIARRYEASRPGYPSHVVEFVTATAGLGPQAAVLEVGCGTGQLTERLAYSGFRLTAIDIGPSMIAAARRRLAGTEVSFQTTSFEELDAVDASFDLVISSAAFHWIDPEV